MCVCVVRIKYLITNKICILLNVYFHRIKCCHTNIVLSKKVRKKRCKLHKPQTPQATHSPHSRTFLVDRLSFMRSVNFILNIKI